jgi:hypothetical protein
VLLIQYFTGDKIEMIAIGVARSVDGEERGLLFCMGVKVGR